MSGIKIENTKERISQHLLIYKQDTALQMTTKIIIHTLMKKVTQQFTMELITQALKHKLLMKKTLKT